ncbi:phosphonate transport system permease protein [Halorubrum xinjiangense]|uniref:Phosphonate transport system permease protein n=1 Tax=Halorubrum xinjiangense TaxID=261291 RepID=A0A1G7N1V5_9EURY|nr:phosphonate ABC transporter, permease protein PhnE [Halorubrum xinjiangense]SDF67897.1 phosphonate transport system permease protein [Halorubrum xinjiangense]
MATESSSPAGSTGAANRRSWQRPTAFRSRRVKWLVYGLVLALIAWSVASLQITPARFLSGIGYGYELIDSMLPPETGNENMLRLFDRMIETIAMAMVATVAGIAISLPVAFGAAENISPKPTYYLSRGIISATRAIDGLIVAIIAVIALGFGPLAGIVAISFKTIGFFSKLFAEDLEDIDMGGVEAVRATGASRFQSLVYGVVPQVVPRFAGLAVYRWDINIRSSTIVGIVGAGGIGVLLQRAYQRYEYDYVAAILIAIIAVVLVAEFVSALVRRRVQ